MLVVLFVANWKMHGGGGFCRRWVREFVDAGGGVGNAEVVVCAPFVYLNALRGELNAAGLGGVGVGAQDVSRVADDGAFTGEVSARMLKDCGCRYAIVGHSERRAGFGDDEATVREKLRAVVGAGLCPVLCVGESEDERGMGNTPEVVCRQIGVLDGLDAARVVVAYEPLWAIGSGRTPSASDIGEVVGIIRAKLDVENEGFKGRISVLYGGSVRADNVASLLGGGVDGALVGGASLDAAAFAAVMRMP